MIENGAVLCFRATNNTPQIALNLRSSYLYFRNHLFLSKLNLKRHYCLETSIIYYYYYYSLKV